MCKFQSGFGGLPTADSRIAVPCPSDRNALRNPPRQHVPNVSKHIVTTNHNGREKNSIHRKIN